MRRFNAAFAIACAVVPTTRAPSIDLGVQQGSGLRRRALRVEQVIDRIREKFSREINEHNAHVTADSESRPSLRGEVLQQFPPKARRLAR